MKHERHFMGRILSGLLAAILPLAMVVTAAELQGQKTKKFLTKPLVIEDQGSFFIGGVPKVTDYATVPAPNHAKQAMVPNQRTIGQMYVQFEIPLHKAPKMPPVVMVHGSSH